MFVGKNPGINILYLTDQWQTLRIKNSKADPPTHSGCLFTLAESRQAPSPSSRNNI